MQKKVIIVGAGPVGLVTALLLAQQGVSSTVVTACKEYSCTGSRAIVIDHNSLNLFDSLGLYDSMRHSGLIAAGRSTYLGTKKLFEVGFNHSRIPLFLNLPQSKTEEILIGACQSNPHITVMWQCSVTDIETSSCGIMTLGVDSAGSRSEIEADYVVAADGCRSTMRTLCKMPFVGSTCPSRFVVADIAATLDFEREHRFHFNHPANPGGTLLFVPQPQGIWRIDWQIDDPEIVVDDRYVTTMLGRILPGKKHRLVWYGKYQFSQRLIPSMNHQQVFFAGDAAHLVNPFGARGMNSGLQDAHSLARHLGAVIMGTKPESFLAGYHRERWPENHRHQEVTINTMNFISPQGFWRTRKRNGILRLASRFPYMRRFVNSGKMSALKS